MSQLVRGIRGSDYFIRGFGKGFKLASSLVSTLINSLLLSVVYFLGVGFSSLIAKAIGRHFLDKGKQTSYWHDIPEIKREMNRHYRQF